MKFDIVILIHKIIVMPIVAFLAFIFKKLDNIIDKKKRGGEK